MNVFLVYDDCCIYEIVILNYFMKFTGQDIKLCSPDGKAIRCMEGYSVNVDLSLGEVETEDVNCLVIPGGKIAAINTAEVHSLIQKMKKKDAVLAAICAGVDVLDEAGVLREIKSTHSEDLDVCRDQKVITARANAYVDFAIEVAKELDLFEDQQDLKETIDFWKYHKRMQ